LLELYVCGHNFMMIVYFNKLEINIYINSQI